MNLKRPKAFDVSVAAVEYVSSNPPPTYAEMDCYRFVRQCVRDNGGDMKYAGSNDVFRNGITEHMPLSDAIAQDKLKSGWALFIVEPVGSGTPEKYRNDGLGDASHMGLYTDLTNNETGERVEVAHSSASRGKVAASTLKNAWNWAAKLKDVDYSDWDEEAEEADSVGGGRDSQRPQRVNTAVIVADTLRARKTLSTRDSGNVVMTMRKGQVLTGIQTGFTFDSGEPAVYGKIQGTRHPHVYAAVSNPGTGELYLQVNAVTKPEAVDDNDGAVEQADMEDRNVWQEIALIMRELQDLGVRLSDIEDTLKRRNR